jgi:hypothetical protein
MDFKKIFCRHDWKRTSDTPPMVADENSMCAYQTDYVCKKCDKVKEVWSDMHAGMMIIETKDEIIERKLKELGI